MPKNSSPYNAAITREQFLFFVTRTTARLLNEGFSKDEAVQKIIDENLFQYPTEKWKYILGFESAIMKQEDKQTLRDIGYSGLEESYSPWVKKMTEKDRLILRSKLTSFPELEWTRGNRTWWIGRLKKEKDNIETKSETKL